MTQPELFPPSELRPKLSGAKLGAMAAQAAADAADRRDPLWTERAYRAVIDYMRLFPGRPFTTDEVRLAATSVPTPPDDRSWGAVILRVKREGRIRSLGYRHSTNPICHNRPVSVWQEVT